MGAKEVARAMRRATKAMNAVGQAMRRAFEKAGEVAEECPRCGGTGEVPLLTSVRTCQRCEGVGVVLPITEE